MLPGSKTSITEQRHLLTATDENHCDLFLNVGMIQSTLKSDKNISILLVQLITTEVLKLPQPKNWPHIMFPLHL